MKFNLIASFLAGRAEGLCRELLPQGTKAGNVWLVGDVAGNPGKSLNVTLEGPKAGCWFDHAANEGGDALDLIRLNRNLPSTTEAVDWARSFMGLPPWKPGEDGPRAPKPKEDLFDPLKKGFKRKGTEEWMYGTKAWAYRDAASKLIGYVVRFEWGEGKKDVIPLRFDVTDGKWHWKGWTGDEKRPIYNRHLLDQRPDSPVLIVEGEKTCDAATKLFPGMVCITWQGGTKSVSKVDWTPVTARKTVYLWPDNDDPGRKAMAYLRAIVSGTIVRLPAELPDGWDIADAPPDDFSPEGTMEATIHPPASNGTDAPPFRFLGHDTQSYFYLPDHSSVPIMLAADRHTELNLLRIAPDSYWIEHRAFLKEKALEVDYRLVARHLIDAQHQVGLFSRDRIRGVGVYLDSNDIVFNTGDRLIVNGSEIAYVDYNGRYTYVRPTRELDPITWTDAMSDEESAKILAAANLLPYDFQNRAWALTGWIVCAILNGILPWRPTIWLSGPSGSGKTTTIENFIALLLGALGVRAMGSSSEAGFRQFAALDALAFIVDETECEGENDQRRIQSILHLIRQSSSNSTGFQLKGSTSGKADIFNMQSIFCFASTAIPATQRADVSRITPILLKAVPTDDPLNRFTQLMDLLEQTTMRPDWCRAWQARIISLAKVFRASFPIFRAAVADAVGNARSAQQFGALLAGWWLVSHSSQPSEHEAAQAVAALGISDERVVGSDEEHHQCLAHLLQYLVTIEVPDQNYRNRISVGNCLQHILSIPIGPKEQTIKDTCKKLLLDYGIKVDPDDALVTVSDSHSQLRKIFTNTQWDRKWSQQFARLKGSIRKPCSRFGMVTNRAVAITFEALDLACEEETP